MKKASTLFIVLCCIIVACDSAKTAMNKSATLKGTWELNFITGPRIAFDGLYPSKKPIIFFDLKQNRVSGTNSCNSYSGMLLIDVNKINFKEAKMVSTRMACESQGEQIYMSILEQINTYSISDNGKTLNFLMGDIVMMRFEKK